MQLKIKYKKNYTDSIFNNVDVNETNKIMDWWMYRDKEPILIIDSDSLKLKLEREDIFNIEVKKRNTFKNPNGILN